MFFQYTCTRSNDFADRRRLLAPFVLLLKTLFLLHLLSISDCRAVRVESMLDDVVVPELDNHLRSSRSPTTSHPRICLVCNAENRTTARHTADRFPEYEGWFAIWRESLEADIVREGKHHLVNASGSSHAEGWDIAIKAARRTGEHVCDYFFFVDDDVVWSVNDAGNRLARMLATRKLATKALDRMLGSSNERDPGDDDVLVRASSAEILRKKTTTVATFTPSELLSSFIEFYLPAVVVFQWPHGRENPGGKFVDDNFPNLDVFNARYQGSAVQPATGFDNGNIVLHSSVVDFFVPFWLGGGFVADFVVHHTLLNVFVPFLFHGDAVCLNGLQYKNPLGSRHPNDGDLYFRYRKFLLPALKCPSKRWGPHLLDRDIDWAVSTAQVDAKRSEQQRRRRLTFPQVTDLHRMSSFFNISHPTIRESPFLRKLYDAETIDAVERLAERVLPPDLACTQLGAKLMELVTTRRYKAD